MEEFIASKGNANREIAYLEAALSPKIDSVVPSLGKSFIP